MMEKQKPLREAQPKTSSSVTLPLHPNGRARSGACIQSITVSGRIERVADTGKPKPSRHGLQPIKTDLKFLIERISKLPTRKELALRPLYIIGGRAGLANRLDRTVSTRLPLSHADLFGVSRQSPRMPPTSQAKQTMPTLA